MTPRHNLLPDTGQLQSPMVGVCWVEGGGRCRVIYRKSSFLFTEIFLLFFFLPQWLHAEPSLWRKDLCVSVWISFRTCHSQMFFLQVNKLPKKGRFAEPEHSLAAGLEAGYCHNSKWFATWVPSSEHCRYGLNMAPEKLQGITSLES